MEKTITIERLEIYNSYRGDIDVFLRRNRPNEKQKFGSDTNAWNVISNKLQDIELISKKLTA